MTRILIVDDSPTQLNVISKVLTKHGYEVITAAEGKAPAVLDCTQYMDSCPSGAIGTCAISPFLSRFQTKIDDFLMNLTLKDIL